MIYLAIVGVLYRPPALFFPEMNAGLRTLSRRRVRQIAHETTTIAGDLHRANLARFLPTGAVTALLSARATHLLESSSEDPYVSQAGLQGLEHCTRILERLQEVHPSADFAIYLLKQAASKSVCATQNKIETPNCLPCFPTLVSRQSRCRTAYGKAFYFGGSLSPSADNMADNSEPMLAGVALN